MKDVREADNAELLERSAEIARSGKRPAKAGRIAGR